MMDVKRRFLPESEWLFYNIFCNSIMSDEILISFYNFVYRESQLFYCVDKWFYLRYNSPSYHIRFRFHLKDGVVSQNFKEVLYNFILLLEAKNLTWKVQIDTYDREIERYGGKSIILAESLFHIDSNAIIRILNQRIFSNDIDLKVLVGLKSIFNLLEDFKLDHEECIKLTSNYLSNKIIFRNIETTRALKNRYKYFLLIKEKASQLLKSNYLQIENKLITFPSLSLRSHENKFPIQLVIGELKSSQLMEFILDIIHMSINRLYSIYSEKYEILLLYLLNKYYSSVYYSNKYNNKNK
ncbi:MAG: thiopeptide-type bacteriocin biosynthesis protein [Saprospiraceae bacterium]